MWFYIIIGVFFIAIGLAVHLFKWYFLISGYNTMSKEKKVNVDTKGLGRLMGIYSYVNGSVFIVMGVLQAMGLKPGITPAIVFFSIKKSCGALFSSEGFRYCWNVSRRPIPLRSRNVRERTQQKKRYILLLTNI